MTHENRDERVRQIADELQEEIHDVLARRLDGPDSSIDTMLGFLAIAPTMIGKAMVVFEEQHRRQAVHELVFAIVNSTDKMAKEFNDFIDRGE